MLTLRHALVRQHYGRALKIMMKQSEDKATKDVDGRMVEVSQSDIIAASHFKQLLVGLLQFQYFDFRFGSGFAQKPRFSFSFELLPCHILDHFNGRNHNCRLLWWTI